MEMRPLGSSEIRVPSVIFGAWAIGGWYWGGSDDVVAIASIRKALDAGVTCIDTAPIYGCGRSEEVVGRALAGRRGEAIIATKCGLRWDREEGEFFFDDTHPSTGKPMKVYRNLRAGSIMEECERSLRRLATDVIDLYQCHWPDATTDLDETMDAMLRLREQGKIRAIGVSNFTPAMMDRCRKVAPVASDQPEYSLLKREIEADVLPYCRANGIATIVYSPLEQGLLTGAVTMERAFPEGDYRSDRAWFQRPNRRRVLDTLARTVRPIAAAHGATLGQVAIAWTIGEPGVTAAIVGARTPEQAEENARGADVRLTEDERRRIRLAFEALGAPLP
jgi:aryl-alcohol dehydrogenase-like predicted oxidoreductase